MEPINIGTGKPTSINELATIIAKIVDYAGKIEWDTSKPSGVTRKVLGTSKVEKVFPGFEYTDLYAGLKKTIDWYMNNKEIADKRL